ncbi:MAG: APC family permease [Dehalococcoidia bacterium]
MDNTQQADESTREPDDRLAAQERPEPLTPDLELREIRQGTKPGSRYVRLTRRRDRPFERLEEGEYRATEAAIRPRSPAERVWRGFKRVVVGTPLATSQLLEERLSKLKALAVFSSNNLSSSAYATEEILLILVLAGTGVFSASIPISIAIVLLVGVVALSYSQVIVAYPNGGGSYVVAKENLGMTPGITAGASLIVDYTLTVAVSTAAGVAAITSAAPELHDQRVLIASLFVVALTLANLRGLRESGTYFAIPTYFFIVSFAGMIVVGLVRLALGHDLSPEAPSDIIEPGTGALGLFLILRAFSSGSAALTGIEAVSNGVPSFKPPEARNANATLAWMVVILAFFFLGLTVLAYQLDVQPSETKTVVAQVAEGVFGTTPLFYIVQATTTMILILAANTSFVGLPALASVMAKDRVLPRQFSFRGDRLAFSHGIVVLGLASIGLLIVFQADTHALIPLYAVGVFIGFTLSQAGLALRWYRDGSASARRSMVINAVGAAATGIVALIIALTKFVDGAWITLAAIGVLVIVLQRIYHHYARVEQQLSVETAPPAPPLRDERGPARPIIVPVEELNQAVLRTLDYARSLSNNVTAVHVSDEVEQGEALRAQWDRMVTDIPIVIIESPYRSFLAPMLAYIDAVDRADPGAYITVVLPEFVPAHFWEGILHNQSAVPLKRALLHRPNTVLIDVPYHLR